MCCTTHYKDFETMENQVETIKYTPEKAKQNALAKLDLIRICLYLKFYDRKTGASSSVASSKNITGRKPSLQVTIAEFLSFIQPS